MADSEAKDLEGTGFPMTVQALINDGVRRYPEPAPRPLTAVPSQGRPALNVVRVRVLASDALTREGVIGFLVECPDVQVLSEQPASAADVVLVVADRVTDNTIRTLRSLRDEAGPRLVLLVGELDPGHTADVMQAGAVGIMRRGEVTRAGLRRLIRSVVAGEAVVPPDVLTVLLGRPSSSGGWHRLGPVGLNDREEKVLRLLADGSDTREISHKLCYSERTVKTIIQDITHRFGLRNRSHAVAYAIRQGLI